MNNEITTLILETATELGDDEIGEIENLNAETILFGEDGVLDSMGLVTLIVAVEQAIEDKFDVSVSLADEKAMSQSNSPYQSVATLAAYATSQIDEN